MKPLEHIERLEHEVHQINQDGHIKGADEYVAMNDLQHSLYKLRCAFEARLSNDEAGSSTTAGEIIDEQ